MSAPCYQCDRRSESCHATCADYRDFCAAQSEAKERRRQYYDADGYARIKAQNLYKMRRIKR